MSFDLARLWRAGTDHADGDIVAGGAYRVWAWAGGFMETSRPAPEEPDALEQALPPVWAALRDKLYVDEFYGATVIAFYEWWAQVADWLDRRVWGGLVSRGGVGLPRMGAVESLARYECGGRRL